MEGLVVLAVLLAFVIGLRVFGVVFGWVCRLLPMNWRIAVYNWLFTYIFIDEEEEVC